MAGCQDLIWIRSLARQAICAGGRLGWMEYSYPARYTRRDGLGNTFAQGSVLNTGRQFIETNMWESIAPGMAIMLVVMGFNVVGDSLRDALDLRLRT
jgi:hypothetical protein